jgi:surface protein
MYYFYKENQSYMKVHYQTLGLQEGASQNEIKEAYERLSKELDPTNNNEDFIVEEFIKVREAYKALSSSSILATEEGARNQSLKDSISNIKNQVSENRITKVKSTEANFNSMIYLDKNGITIKASENAIIGEEYELNGEKYKVVDEKMLREMVKNEEDVTRVVTSHITDMKNLFNWVTSFNQNIGSWDTSNVTDMQGMFSVAPSFNQDISNWDVSQVTKMNNMFIGAKSFNQDISKWDVGNVKSMQNIFRDATSFDQDLSNWNSEGLHNALAWKAKNNQDMFSSPFSFDGRIRRTEYNISVIILIILSSCVNAAALSSDLPFLYFTYIPIFWLMWAQGAKRCHDLGRSGLFQIIPFYPIVMMFSESISEDKSEVNEYEINSEEKGKLVDLNKTIKACPNDPITYCARGKVKFKLGDFNSALSDFNKAIDLDTNNAFYYFYRGAAKRELKNKNGVEADFNKAIANFDKAIKANPKFANNYKFRGFAKKELGLQLEAFNDWQKAADLGDQEAAQFVRDDKYKEQKNLQPMILKLR